MRRTVCLLAVLLVLSLLGSDSPKEYDGATEMNGIEGTWRRVKVEYEGQPVKGFPHSLLTFRNGRWEASDVEIPAAGKHTTNLRRTPAHLDELVEDGRERNKVWLLIFQVDGDTLRIAFRADGRGRPESFNEAGVYTVVWKRVKK
jgi:uncharacterized protein (TIGR03067 family)